MEPMLLIVFVPVVVGAVAFVALLLGAAAAGTWETLEEQRPEGTPVTEPASHVVIPLERSQSQAA